MEEPMKRAIAILFVFGVFLICKTVSYAETYRITPSNGIEQIGNSSGTLQITNKDIGGHIHFSTSESVGTTSVRMRIENTGKIGINTVSPTALLDIDGYFDEVALLKIAQWGNRNWSGFRLDRNHSEKWFIGMSASDDMLLIRRNASSNEIVIDENGNVGIGRTPTSGGFNKFEVEGLAAKTAGGSTWATLSDGRLKDIKADYHKGLPEIMALRPVVFNYKKDNPRNFPSDQRNVGFVAQEVEPLFPDAVNKGRDGYMELNLHEINVAMVNAVKELKAENDEIRCENKSFRAENAMLKRDIEKIKTILGI
jgi:hypothetical protein